MKRTENYSRNSGFTLVEALTVIAIISIVIGMMSAGISLIYSRDASKCAKLINSALEETRMRSLSQEGVFLLTADDESKRLKIEASAGGEPEEIKLPENVEITINAKGTGAELEGERMAVEFDKAAGAVKKAAINGVTLDKADYHTLQIHAKSKKNDKKATVYLILLTGKHYIEYNE